MDRLVGQSVSSKQLYKDPAGESQGQDRCSGAHPVCPVAIETRSLIRVGGNTQDRLVYNASIPTPYQDDFPAVPSNYTSSKQLFPECANGSINQEYYLASGNLPIGTQFTWGINFGIDNINEAVIEADAIQRAFSVCF